MPNNTVKAFAKESGKTVEHVEKLWDEAKAKADKKFKTHDEHYWAYVNITVQMMLGLKKPKTKK